MTNIMNITSSEWGIEIGKLVDEYDLPSEQKELVRQLDESLKNNGDKHSPQSKSWFDKVKDFFD